MRDFEFSPDDGRITSVIIDKLGIPALPVRLFACYKIQAQDIANINWNSITLQQGSEAYVEQLTSGLFDKVSNLLPVGLTSALECPASGKHVNTLSSLSSLCPFSRL